MPIKQALGRGLAALIPEGPKVPNELSSEKIEVHSAHLDLPLEKIRVGSSQPRKEFDPGKHQELMESFRSKGILQPILVRRVGEFYEIIAGERRYRAAKALGWTKIPALVKNAPPSESLELALIENIQREDLNPLEEAKAYERLQNEFHLTQEAIAKGVGKDRSSVANAVRLLSLPEVIQHKILKNQLSAGHAKVLLSVTNPVRQEWLSEQILKEGLSVRQAEQLLRAEQPSKISIRKKVSRGNDPHIQLVEEELQRVLGTRVRITSGGKGGHVQIDYYSSEDLERILGLLGLKKNW